LEDSLQILPWHEPLAGGASWQAAKQDPAGAFCLANARALRAFDQAQALQEAGKDGAPGWEVLLCHARSARKLKQPAESWLAMQAHACHAAALEGGVLVPFYALHAARMRLLLAAPAARRWGDVTRGGAEGSDLADGWDLAAERESERQLLCLVGRYCFLPTTAAQRAQPRVPQGGTTAEAELAADWRCLLADCCAAMRWCLDRLPTFHPAAHRWE
jgi:hypothetical protein